MKVIGQHIQLNVSDTAFYRKLLTYLGGKVLSDDDGYLGIEVGQMSYWVFPVEAKHKDKPFNRRARGIHHIAFRVEKRKDVDKFYTNYLQTNSIPVLYKKPQEYPDFGDNYYAVKCEDPDGIVIEVFHRDS